MQVVDVNRQPSGLAPVDALSMVPHPTLAQYITAASAYVMQSQGLTAGQKKRAQLQLGDCLAAIIAYELETRQAALSRVIAGEQEIAGALRKARSDVTDIGATDGVRLAVEIKPVYLAVGRATWNRFGDVRSFAVNVHLKFPFAIVGGIMPIPTFEWDGKGGQKTTVPLIRRLVRRFEQIGCRKNDGDPPHAIEAACVLVFDPNTGQAMPNLPAPGSGLCFDDFISVMADLYDGRFVY